MAKFPPTAGKIGLIILLLLGCLIPDWMISRIIDERENRQREVEREFAGSWGPEQQVEFPVLVVPYRAGPDHHAQYLKLSAAQLTVNARLVPEERRRGLLHARVYTVAIDIQGAFRPPAGGWLPEEPEAELRWQDAFVVIETSSRIGMQTGDHFTWNGRPIPWQACGRAALPSGDCASGSVLVARLRLTGAPDGEPMPFQASLTLRGTSVFRVAADGSDVDVVMTGAWQNPSFIGTRMPAGSTIGAAGFEAAWKFSDHVARTVRVSNSAAGEAPSVHSVGVKLLEATPIYRMINRVSKYGMLFVVLCLTCYFLFEMLTGTRIHIIQYGLLAASLLLFSLLLLSIGEPLGYDAGFAVSSLLVLAQASAYTWTVTRRLGSAGLFAGMLAGLFGFVYVLVGMETYSLLAGSLALFFALSVVMLVTQKIDWARG